MKDLICENPPIERNAMNMRIMRVLSTYGFARPIMGVSEHGREKIKMWEINWSWLFRDDWIKKNEKIFFRRLGEKGKTIFQNWVSQAQLAERNIAPKPVIPVSIAPDALQIFEVVDGKTEQVVAIEFTNGPETWSYYADQSKFETLRIGKVPRKSLDEDYERRLIYQLPSKSDQQK